MAEEVMKEEKQDPRDPMAVELRLMVDAMTVEKLKEIAREKNESLVQSFHRAVALQYLVAPKLREGYKLFLKQGDELYEIIVPER